MSLSTLDVVPAVLWRASLSEPHPLTSLQMLWIIQIWSQVEYLIDFVIIDIIGTSNNNDLVVYKSKTSCDSLQRISSKVPKIGHGDI